MITQYPINLKYKKSNGLWVLDIDAINIPFEVKKRAIVCLPAGEIGGNHFHPRQEAFIALSSNLILVWQDQEGNNHTESMKPGKHFYLTIVASQVPHLIKNQAEDAPAFFVEYADQIQQDVKTARIEL